MLRMRMDARDECPHCSLPPSPGLLCYPAGSYRESFPPLPRNWHTVPQGNDAESLFKPLLWVAPLTPSSESSFYKQTCPSTCGISLPSPTLSRQRSPDLPLTSLPYPIPRAATTQDVPIKATPFDQEHRGLEGRSRQSRSSGSSQSIARDKNTSQPDSEIKHRSRKMWCHALERAVFNAQELHTLSRPHRRVIYTATLERHIERIHNELMKTHLFPVPMEQLERYHGMDSRIAKSMVSGLQKDVSELKMKKRQLQRMNDAMLVYLRNNEIAVDLDAAEHHQYDGSDNSATAHCLPGSEASAHIQHKRA